MELSQDKFSLIRALDNPLFQFFVAFTQSFLRKMESLFRSDSFGHIAPNRRNKPAAVRIPRCK
jgi:hypothetical protein